jgi:hypothetical protein
LPGFRKDAYGDDLIAEGQRRLQGAFSELADAADRHDHQAA